MGETINVSRQRLVRNTYIPIANKEVTAYLYVLSVHRVDKIAKPSKADGCLFSFNLHFESMDCALEVYIIVVNTDVTTGIACMCKCGLESSNIQHDDHSHLLRCLAIMRVF